MNKYKIGIIAEDKSDVLSIKILIKRISSINNITVQSFVGHGCGKIARKCNAWADVLHKAGCSVLLLVHDLDKNNKQELQQKLNTALSPCPILNNLIVIPVEELEAWILSDPAGIKKAIKLKQLPKIKPTPELIISPKEILEKIIYKYSNKEKKYINARHNEQIFSVISIGNIKKRCPAFNPFYEFIKTHVN